MENEILGIGSRVGHKEYGMGVVIQAKSKSYLITFVDAGLKEIARSYQGLEVIERVEPEEGLISFEMVENTLSSILRRYADIPEIVPKIGEKWMGGSMILQPSNPDLKPYEMPISTFFNKIIMLRERLRVIEQKINNTDSLSEDEKIVLQQYVTRCYGTLTSFNILFKNKDDYFIGEGSRRP